MTASEPFTTHDHPACPECGSKHYYRQELRQSVARFRCVECGHRGYLPYDELSIEQLNASYSGKRSPHTVITPDQYDELLSVAKVSDNGIKKETWDETENSATGTCITAIKPRTTEDAAKLFKVDLNVWEPSGLRINSWDVTNKNGKTYTNYQVRVTFKRKVHSINPKEAAEIFKKEIAHYTPIIPVFNKHSYDIQKECIISVADPHIGMLSWHPETGSNYDLKIAQKNITNLMADILSKTTTQNPSKYYLVVPGDFFHSNNPEGTTKKGTRLDMDGRWKKVYRCGCRIMEQMIDSINMFAPVDVLLVLGNHDEDTIFYLREHLMALYRDHETINIVDCISSRYYITIGCTDIGITHSGKPQSLFTSMSNEYGWDKDKYHEFYTAHRHKKEQEDHSGLLVRTMRAACPSDKWTHDSGYTGTVKGIEANIYDLKTGHETQFVSKIKFNEGV